MNKYVLVSISTLAGAVGGFSPGNSITTKSTASVPMKKLSLLSRLLVFMTRRRMQLLLKNSLIRSRKWSQILLTLQN